MELLRALRVNAVELLRQPGATKDIVVEIPGTDVGAVHEQLTGDVGVDLTLEAMNDGIVVTGVVRSPWSGVCRRCLKDLDDVAVTEIDEMYQVALTDPEAYPIENNQLDLAPMVREVVLLALDNEHLCTDDCDGLCSACGVDRNSASCTCDTTVVDNRWAALDGLTLDD